jgi:hypothetical protein
MEGILEKWTTSEGGMFSGGVWKKYFFILHQQILMITDLNERTKIVGKIHMAVSKVLPEEKNDQQGEFKINSGLIEVRLKASTIKEKINWKNMLALAQKNALKSTSNDPRASVERMQMQAELGRKTMAVTKKGRGFENEYFVKSASPKKQLHDRNEFISDNESYQSRHTNQ